MRVFFVSLLTLTYPLLVFFGVGHFEPRGIALLLAALALARALGTREKVWLAAAAGALCLAGLSAYGNQLLPLKLYPLLVNAVLLLTFGVSLAHPPTVIERLARLKEPNLPMAGILYTRKVTWVWCGFFVFNGLTALVTAMWCSDAVWALYNGMISYILMGALFAMEWFIRQRFKGKMQHD